MGKKRTETEENLCRIPDTEWAVTVQRPERKAEPYTAYHKVSAADTLDAIASRYRTTTAEIVSVNKRQYPQIVLGILEAGTTLTIPTKR